MSDELTFCAWCGKRSVVVSPTETDTKGVRVNTYACLECGASHDFVRFPPVTISWSDGDTKGEPDAD